MPINVDVSRGRLRLHSQSGLPLAILNELQELGYDVKNSQRRVLLANRIDHIEQLEQIPDIRWNWSEYAWAVSAGMSLRPLGPTDTDSNEPWDWQEKGRDWLLNNKRTILSHGVGLGKTKTAIDAAETITFANEPIYVICPKPIIPAWRAEIVQWAKYPNRFLVTNYEQAHRIKGYSPVLILDEAHRLRNRNSKRRKTIFRLALRCDYVFMLTAAPIQNHFRDIWSLLNILYPKRFPSYWQFVREFYQVYPGHWTMFHIGPQRNKIKAEKLLSDYCQSFPRSLAFPDEDVHYDVRRFELGSKHRAIYDEIESGSLEAIEKAGIQDVLAKVTRLRQAAISPKLINDEWPIGDLIPFAEHIIKENEQAGPFIVFSEFNEPLRLLRKQVSPIAADFKYSSYTGENPQWREKTRIAFCDGEFQPLFANTKAGGEGLSFAAKDAQALFISLWYNPETIKSCIGRLTRGEPRDVQVFVLCPTNTIMERVIDIIVNKEQEVRLNKTGLTQLMRGR